MTIIFRGKQRITKIYLCCKQIEMTSEYPLVDIVPTNIGTEHGPYFKRETVIKRVELMSDIEMELEWLRHLRSKQNNGENYPEMMNSIKNCCFTWTNQH